MNCENCKSTEEKGAPMDCEKSTEGKGAPSVPYLVHDSEMFRMEEANRRLAAVVALEVVALVLMIVTFTILH